MLFLKIIILCIWCNRICWHALMFKKHSIFQILYIIVGPLCPASLKRFVFYKVPPSDKHSLLWLANWHSAFWLVEHHKPRRKCNTPFHNRELQLSKWMFYHQFKPESGIESHDRHMMLVCISKQAAIKMISDGLYTLLWCDHLSLSHTLTHTQAAI